MKQKILGQFFTNKNVFKNKAFLNWFNLISKEDKTTVLEPFAGKNGLIIMLEELNLIKDYKSFDIEPKHPNVEQHDSILSFPKGFNICITNPPFLAKNVATRKNIPATIEPYSDLYEKCLDLCLKNCKYVAAIVPESFIVSPFFRNRLHAVISLTEKALFQHTEHPVCLALFNPEKTSDFVVYQDEKLLGNYRETQNRTLSWLSETKNENIKFHDKLGVLGLFNIDGTSLDKEMHFDRGELIDSKDVGYHARLRTRINILSPNGKELTKTQLSAFIKVCNKVLREYRQQTQDMFMTSFKGLRSDGKYRRRLDYSTARLIVNKAYTLYFKI